MKPLTLCRANKKSHLRSIQINQTFVSNVCLKPVSTSTESPSDASTRQRLLDTAAELIAVHGFEKVSLRDLTAAAATNLASVNYHFGSKDGLMDEVVADFLNPLNEERLARLTEAEARFAPEPPPLRDILDALLRPTITKIRHSDLSEMLFSKLMSRCLSDRMNNLPNQVTHHFEQVFRRFIAAASRVLPELPPTEIAMRMSFSVGALLQTVAHTEVMEKISHGMMKAPSSEELLEQIIAFSEAGFLAPPQSSQPPKR